MRAFQIGRGRADEGVGAVGYVEEVRLAAEADVKRAPDDGGLHRLGRIGSHAGVPPDAVNGQRAEPDARNAVLQKVDSRVFFVTSFERAVMRVHAAGAVFGRRAVAFAEDGG